MNGSVNNRRVDIYVAGIVALSASALISITLIVVLKTETDNTSVIATIIAFVGLPISTLISLILRENHMAVNSRLTQLLEVTADSSKAMGVLEEKENRKVRIEDELGIK